MQYVVYIKRPIFHVRYCLLLVILAVAWGCAPIQPEKRLPPAPVDFTMTILHTNDTHSSFGGVTDKGMTCYAAMCEDGKGGYVRLDQAVRAIRQGKPDALFLEAGDIYQGTLFWTLYKEKMPLTLVDMMGYQAMIAGNHEFDDGTDTYLRMANRLKTPVLGANLRFRDGLESKIKPYIIEERDGRKIGIIGVVTPETAHLSSPGPDTTFTDVKEALQKTVAELETQGVNIIVAITHYGLQNDKELARELDGVDVIVGAHSHSLLSNDPTLQDRTEGPYPVVEKTPRGEPILIVTAYTACIYLGKLEVGFDKNGIAKTWQGDPIPLDDTTLKAMNAPAPNAKLVRLVDDFAKPVEKLMDSQIGFIKSDLAEGIPLESPNVKICRQEECLSGNVAADAMRKVSFDDVQIALVNGGGLRNSLPSGKITPGHVLATLPFQNTAVKTSMSGEIIKQALEHGVSTYGEDEGRFLQVSGLRYVFDPSRKVGDRVTSVDVMGTDGKWSSLNPKASYVVASVDYIAKGGDGFVMLKALDWGEGDKLINDVLRLYLENNPLVKAEREGRITVKR